MEKIYNSIKKISKLCIIIGLSFALLISLVVGVLAEDDEFIPFLANSLSSLVLIALYVLPIIFLIMKNKEKEAKFFLTILITYFLISSCTNLIAGGYSAGQYFSTIDQIYGVFSFITGLALLACLVLFILAKVFNLKIYKILNILVLIQLCLFFIFFVVTIIRNIDLGSEWIAYFIAISSTLVLPYTFVCVVIYLSDDTPIVESSKKESTKDETSNEDKQEEIKEE